MKIKKAKIRFLTSLAMVLALLIATGPIHAQSCDRTVNTSMTLAQIQSAIGAGPGNVCFQAGTYNLSGPIYMADWTSVTGLGSTPGGVLLKRTGSNTDAVIISPSGTGGFTINNLSIDGSNVATYGVLLYQSEYIELNSLHINNVGAISVGVVEVYHTEFNNLVLGAGIGFGNSGTMVSPHIWVLDSNKLWFTGNTLTGKQRTSTHDGDGGITMYGSSEILIWSNSYTYAGNYLAASGNGPTNNVSAWDNTIAYANEWPFDVVSGAHDVLISSNTIYGAYHGAIVLWNVSNIEVAYNTMTGNNTGGHVVCQAINIQGTSSGLNIHNNTANPAPVTC